MTTCELEVRIGGRFVCGRAYLLKLRHHDRLLMALELDKTGFVEIEVEAGVFGGQDVTKWRLCIVVDG